MGNVNCCCCEERYVRCYDCNKKLESKQVLCFECYQNTNYEYKLDYIFL